MGKITILGLGPGSMDYITSAVINKLQSSDIIIGGKRNIDSIRAFTSGKRVRYIDKGLSNLLDYIKLNMDKKLVIVASGDAGFYGILDFIKRNFPNDELEVLPGVSSMQYMFAKIGKSWWDAYITSVHGRESDYLEKIEEYTKIGILTDKMNTPQVIAKKIFEKGYKDAMVYIGENLSYKNEKISSFKVEELKDYKCEFELNVVVIKRN